MLVYSTSWPDAVGTVGAVATAVAAVVGLLYADRQVRQARAAGRQQLTYSYFARFSAPEMIPFIADWAELIGLGNASTVGVAWSTDDPDARWNEFQAKRLGERLDALLVPNFIEELAGMYNRDLVDRVIVEEFFGQVIRDWWTLGGWFIERQREQDPSNLVQWERMRADMLSPDGY